MPEPWSVLLDTGNLPLRINLPKTGPLKGEPADDIGQRSPSPRQMMCRARGFLFGPRCGSLGGGTLSPLMPGGVARGTGRRCQMADYDIFELGDVRLSTGQTLRNAKLAYKTFGALNSDKSNAIVYPTWYSGQHYDNEWLIGEGMALDPSKYFIIIPNMLGNGLSSSPSNTPPPHNGPRFPNVTFQDNVAQ